jgi:hypothetical protein
MWQYKTKLPWRPSVVSDLLVVEPLDPNRHFAGWLYCELEHAAAAFELKAKMPRRFR